MPAAFELNVRHSGYRAATQRSPLGVLAREGADTFISSPQQREPWFALPSMTYWSAC